MADVTVRRLAADEWAILRGIRLTALRRDPDAFLSTADVEQIEPTEMWRVRTRLRAVAWQSQEPVGLIGWSRHDNYLEIVGLWVQPESRGGEVATQLTDFVLDSSVLVDAARF